MRNHILAGKWWMIQWGWQVLYSVGIHVDKKFKYIDFHLLFAIISLGNPGWPYEDYRAWWSSREISRKKPD